MSLKEDLAKQLELENAESDSMQELLLHNPIEESRILPEVIEVPLVEKELSYEEVKELVAPSESEEFEELENIIDDELSKILEDANTEESNIIEEIPIKETESKSIDTLKLEMLIEKVTHLIDSSSNLMANSSSMIDLSQKVINTDLEHSRQYHSIASDHIEIKTAHYELMTKETSKKIKDNLSYMAIGGIIVLLFPEVLPWIKTGIEWLTRLRG